MNFQIKFETRNPKSETNPNFQNSNAQNIYPFLSLKHSNLEFVSDFVLRISDLSHLVMEVR